MSAQAAGGMMMWLAGILFGVGIALGDWHLIPSGGALSVLGAIYIRKFAETD